MTPEKAQQEVNLLVGFLASYAFRALTSSAEAWLRRTCHLCICGRLAREGAVLASERGLTWREAKVRLDSSDDLQILALATLRLLAWHWMQPITYALLLYSWSDDAYFGKTWNLQAVLAAAVLLREVLYFICTLFALVQCPAFLLIDLAATWRSGARGEAFACVMMPEKFLGWYMQGSVPSPLAVRRFNSYCAVVLLLDGCSVLALWAGLSGWTSRPPVPLLVCYSVTTLSFIAIPCWATSILLARATGVLPPVGHRNDSDSLDIPLGSVD
ncbi:unnamed protein product [Durusdinium trenchii]|uniref:Uncharacterized protein n=2 Tax=Durusdinium trenchii TaxID=1381693 RepID=A0ABP0L6B4_9DINO